MADVFISYAREDHEVAARLAQLLEARGWNVWWDRELVPGESFDEVIEQELTGAKAVIVLWSAVSVQSRWVRSEANAAVEHGTLIPVVLDGTAVPLRFRIVQGVDLVGWDEREDDPRVASLYAGVQALAGPPPAPSHMAPPTAAPPLPAARLPAPAAMVLPPPRAEPPDSDVEISLRPQAASSAVRPHQRRGVLAIIGVLATVVVIVVLAVTLSTGDDDKSEATGSDPSSSTAHGATEETTTATDTGEVDATGPTIVPALVLERGDEGEEVSEIQRWLRDSGTDPDLTVDGLFGPLTERAVRMFEDNNELPVDGRLVIESDEWRRLQAAAEAAQSSTASATSSTTTNGSTPVPDVYGLPADSAVQELQAAGFEVDADEVCSNSVDAGLVRQVTYRDDGTKMIVVGAAGEIDARDAPAGILLSLLVSTGSCP